MDSLPICYLAPAIQVGMLSNLQQERFALIAYEHGIEAAVQHVAKQNGFPVPLLINQPERGDVSEALFSEWTVVIGRFEWADWMSVVYHEVCHLYQVFELAKSFAVTEDIEVLRAAFPERVVSAAIEASEQGLVDANLLAGWEDSFTNPVYTEAAKHVVEQERFTDAWFAANSVYLSKPAEGEAYWAQGVVRHYLSAYVHPPIWWGA
jgi:hypothetical protein